MFCYAWNYVKCLVVDYYLYIKISSILNKFWLCFHCCLRKLLLNQYEYMSLSQENIQKVSSSTIEKNICGSTLYKTPDSEKIISLNDLQQFKMFFKIKQIPRFYTFRKMLWNTEWRSKIRLCWQRSLSASELTITHIIIRKH